MWALVNRHLFEESDISLPACTRGLFLGDGVFTTFLSNTGRLQFWKEHCERLKKDAKTFKLDFNENGLYESIHELLNQNNLLTSTVRVRITLTRGFGLQPLAPGTAGVESGTNSLLKMTSLVGLRLSGSEQPYEIVTLSPFSRITTATHLMLSSFSRGVPGVLTETKHLGYQAQQFAIMEAQENGFEDAIMLNAEGRVSCTTTANIFLLINGTWQTPALSEGALPGVVRGWLLRSGFATEARIEADALHAAEAAFITNSLIGLRPIARINEKVFSLNSLKFPELPNMV